MLSDASGLTVCYMGFSDTVQKRGFTMVYMTHNADYWWSWHHAALIIFFIFQQFSDNIYFLFRFCNDIIFQSNFLSLFKVDLMIYGYHDSFHEKFLYDHRRLHLHLICQFPDCHFFWKCDFFYFFLFLFLWMRNRLLKLKSLGNTLSLTASALIRSSALVLVFISSVIFLLIFSVCLPAVFFYKFQIRCFKFISLISSGISSSLILASEAALLTILAGETGTVFSIVKTSLGTVISAVLTILAIVATAVVPVVLMILSATKTPALTAFAIIVPIVKAALRTIFPTCRTVLTVFHILSVIPVIIGAVVSVFLSWTAICISAALSLTVILAFILWSLFLSRSCILTGLLFSLRHMACVLRPEHLDKLLLWLFSCTGG